MFTHLDVSKTYDRGSIALHLLIYRHENGDSESIDGFPKVRQLTSGVQPEVISRQNDSRTAIALYHFSQEEGKGNICMVIKELERKEGSNGEDVENLMKEKCHVLGWGMEQRYRGDENESDGEIEIRVVRLNHN